MFRCIPMPRFPVGVLVLVHTALGRVQRDTLDPFRRGARMVNGHTVGFALQVCLLSCPLCWPVSNTETNGVPRSHATALSPSRLPPHLRHLQNESLRQPCHAYFVCLQKPCQVVCSCSFCFFLYAGTMQEALCGCRAFVGSSDGATREHLKSEKHKQWEKANKSIRPIKFLKVKPTQPIETTAASSNNQL